MMMDIYLAEWMVGLMVDWRDEELASSQAVYWVFYLAV
jgi:hypothetical protein